MNHSGENGIFISELLDGTCGAIFAFVGRGLGSFNPKIEKDASDKVVNVLCRLGLVQNLLNPIHGLLVHGDGLYLCNEYTLQTEIFSVDALITRTLGLPLFLYVADCPALAIFDPVQKAIALVHSGRKGTNLNICQKTVAYMRAMFGSQAADLLAAITPYIGACGNECYELNFSSAEQISICYPEAVVSRNNNKVYLNIGEAIVSQLVNAGILSEHIEKSTFCTKCGNGTFYSYRERTIEERETKPNNGAILCLTGNDTKAVANLDFSIKQPLLVFLLLF